MRVLRNLYKLLGQNTCYVPIGSMANDVYVIKGKDALVMNDCGGTEEEIGIIEEGLKYWGLSDYPISHVLISHSHSNHMGNAHYFRKRGAKIVAGQDEVEAIETGGHLVVDHGPFKKRHYVPCTVDIKVKDGDVIETAGLKFEVIAAASGHTPGSTIYKLVMDGKTILFTGDVICIDSNNKFAKLCWTGDVGYDREKYFETIKKLSKLHADVILPTDFQIRLKDGWKILQDSYLRALLEFRQPAEYED